VAGIDDQRTRGLTTLRIARWTQDPESARSPAPRPGVPVGTPALSLPPDRRNHQASIHTPRWHYDILRALDYFQAVNAPRDPRLAEAINIVRSSRRKDGRWSLEHSYNGKTYFELERLGAPSRWNTLRALRVLNWWDRRREVNPARLQK
jgi:hypothetical protein